MDTFEIAADIVIGAGVAAMALGVVGIVVAAVAPGAFKRLCDAMNRALCRRFGHHPINGLWSPSAFTTYNWSREIVCDRCGVTAVERAYVDRGELPPS